MNQINLSQEPAETVDKMERMDEAHRYMEIIRSNLEYDLYMQETDCPHRELYKGLFEVIYETVCVKRTFV